MIDKSVKADNKILTKTNFTLKLTSIKR